MTCDVPTGSHVQALNVATFSKALHDQNVM